MKTILYIVCFMLFFCPLVLIGYVSYLEIQQYQPKNDYTINERSYGEPVPIERVTLEEKVVFTGTFVSESFLFIELNNSASDDVRIVSLIDDEVNKGDVLAYVDGRSVVAPVNGIIVDVNFMQQNGYIKILNLDELLFTCYVDDQELNLQKRYEITDELTLELVRVSNIMEDSGRKAHFEVRGEEYFYGQNAVFEAPTGVIHQDVLATKKTVVYQKDSEGPYYIRRVDSVGRVIGEVEVQVGISNHELISISNVEEGWYCDSGYGQFMNTTLGREDE